MESLTGLSTEEIEAPDPTSPAGRRTAKSIDRIALPADAAARIDAWIKQASDSSRGFLALARADVVAFLVKEKPDALSAKDIQRLRSANYDPIRHINWLMPQLKAALASGESTRVETLQAELRGVELAAVQRAANGTLPSHQRKPRKAAVREKVPEEHPVNGDQTTKIS